MRFSAIRVALATTLIAIGITPAEVFAQASDAAVSKLADRERRVKNVVAKVGPAVVAVTDKDGWGSGAIVSADGLVLTAGHVTMHAPGGRMAVHLADGRVVMARALGRNLKTDAALLKIESNTDNGQPWPHVELGNTAGLKRGDWTVTLGHPGGLIDAAITARPAPVRLGRVLSIGARTVVTDGTIIVGDSGGPLFDLNGRLIGVHSMIGSDITNNRHVMIDVIRRDWARLEDGESWGELGDFDTGLVGSLMFGTELTWDEYDARVRRVEPGSPASRAGIRRGDELVSVDGQAIADPLELSLILGERSPGDTISTKVKRQNEVLKLEVTLGSYPETTEEPRVPIRRKPGRFEKAGEFALAEFRPVVARNRGVTVEFVDAREPGKQMALGTVITADGFIATKYSEVDHARDLVCRLDNGQELTAEIMAFEREFDLAIVKVNATRLKPVEWQDVPAEVGQLVVSPSPSGGPVASGVVSVRTRKLDDKGFLGVSRRARRRSRQRGAPIDEIVADGAAERAGLRAGDLIVEINGRIVTNFDDLTRRIRGFKAGERIRVKFERRTGERTSEIREVTVTLSGRFVTGDWRRQFEGKNLLGPPLSQHSSGFPLALQHDTVLNPADCGGPLLNIEGKAVGINIARAGRVMSYAIPASEAQKLVKELIERANTGE